MTFKEIYEKSMPYDKRIIERFDLFTTFITRPLSILITKPLLGTKITPSTVTAISIIFCVLGFLGVSFGGLTGVRVLGWCGFFIWAILDCVDGNLARCTNKGSVLGELWDATGGYVALITITFSSGIAAFYDNNLYDYCDSSILIMLGGAAAIFSIFPRLVFQKKKAIDPLSESANDLANKAHFGIVKKITMNIISPCGMMLVVFLFAIITHTLNFFVLIYALLYFCVMSTSVYRLLKK